MAIDARKGTDAVQYAMAKAYNDFLERNAVAGSFYHADVTSVTSGDFTNPEVNPLLLPTAACNTLAKAATRANLMKVYFNVHIADTLAHQVADTANVVSTPDAGLTDQTATDTLLNALKVAFNAHLTQSGVHYTDDSDNTVSTTDAIGLATSEALADDLTTAFNAHVSGASGQKLNLTSP